MSGKGSGRRPAQVDERTLSSNWERVFGERSFGDLLLESVLQANELLGRGVVANMSLSKSEALGSEPSAPATYVDDATGIQVSEHWWPGQPHDTP